MQSSTPRSTKSTVGPKADFNGDGNGDLAVGAPGEDVGSISDAGGVNVIYGSDCFGLWKRSNEFWSQNSSGVKGVAEAGDRFGSTVSTGDFNRDGFSDLAVAAPVDSVDSQPAAGAVNVLYGSANGLTSAGNRVWDQDTPGVLGSAEPGDEFGLALASRDFNGDGVLRPCHRRARRG
jgi:hypothetical protein